MGQTSLKPKTSWITLGILLVLIAGGLLLLEKATLVGIYHELTASEPEPLPNAISLNTIKNQEQENKVSEPTSNTNQSEEQKVPDPLPATFLLDVPFTTQAPDANWDLPYQEACEEASAITVHYFYEEKEFTKKIANDEILALVEYENEFLGFYKDTTAEETARVIKNYWEYDQVEVLENPSIDDIKRNIFEGRPVIVPAAGKQLGNPNFRNGGPLYHMFVVTGWDEDEFITNDVGTRNGENYRYPYNTVMDAMHDWNGGDVSHGAKRVIIIYPKV